MVEQKAVVTIVGINVDYTPQFEHLQNLLSGLLGVPTNVTIETVYSSAQSGTQRFQAPNDISLSSFSSYHLDTKTDFLSRSDKSLRGPSRKHGSTKDRDEDVFPFASGPMIPRVSSNLSTSSQLSSRHSSSFEMADPPRKLSEIAESPSRQSRSRQDSRRASSPVDFGSQRSIRFDDMPYYSSMKADPRRNSYSNSSQRQRKSHKRPRSSHTPSPSTSSKVRPSPVNVHAPKPRKSNLKKRKKNSSPLVTPEKSDVEADTTTEIIRNLADSPPVVLNPFGEPLTDADIKWAFDQVDGNGDGRITLKEFTQTLASLQVEIDTSKMRVLFEQLDSDKNGCLDYEEFRDALKKVHPTNAEIWQKMLGASTLDLRPRASDLDLEQIRRILADTRSEWTDRVDAMHSFCKHAVQPISPKKFDKMMRPIREHLLQQLSDRRSAVVRECCIVIAKIAMVRQELLTRWAPRILERLFETVRLPVEIMAVSAAQAIKSVIRCVPDSKKLELLQAVIHATHDTHVAARKKAFNCISFLLEQTRENKIGRSTNFWQIIIDSLNEGMKDSSEEVREASYIGTANLYLLNPSRTQKNLLSKLKGARLNRFYKVLDEFTKSLDIHE